MKKTKKQQELQARVIDVIYSQGPISRIDIANLTGITPATISALTAKLIETGLIKEAGEEIQQQTSGRRKILLEIAANQQFFIGTELSEKYFSFCLTDNLGTVLKDQVLNFDSQHTLANFTYQDYLGYLKNFVSQCSAYHPSAIGIALPGHFDAKQNKILTNNPIWTQFDLLKIAQSFDIPVLSENNVQSMAKAQRILKSNKQDSNFLYLHISRGMFCSYMYQGEIYGSHNQRIGEIGHTTVNPDGELCECGKRGCLQTYASEAWIIKKAKMLFAHTNGTYLHQLVENQAEINIKTIINAYHLGDEGINNILQHAFRYLAITLENISLLIDCRTIYLHSELFSDAELFGLLQEKIQQNVSLANFERSQQLVAVPYTDLDGAVGACGFLISKFLLGK
ncbi:ROK family transcriptional regulator [Lapidilactobacillus salsurivasis]